MKKRAVERKKTVKLIITTIIGLYVATQIWPFFSEANNKTYFVDYGKIEEVVPVKAYVIRDEKVISTIQEYSDIELLVQEGSLVAKGQEVARFYLTDDNDNDVEKELRSIETRIDSIKDQQSQGSLFQGDITKLNNQVEYNVNLIESYINNGEFDKIYPLRKSLDELISKKDVIGGSNSFTGANLSELESQKTQLKSKLSSYVKIVSSNKPGYFALGSDGLEELFNLSNIEKLDFESFNMIKEKADKPTDGISIRIVDNFRYNLVIELDNNRLSGIAEGRIVRLRDTKTSDREYRARVRKVITDETEDKSLVILSGNEHMDKLFTNRVLQLDLLKNVYEGITVPNRSIIEIDEQYGVYKVDVNGFIKFVPILIKGQNDDYSIVHNSHFDTVIDGESKRVLTISSYDEIVLDVNGLNEGQKIR